MPATEAPKSLRFSRIYNFCLVGILIGSALLSGCVKPEEGPAERMGRSIDRITGGLYDIQAEENAKRKSDLDRKERELQERERELDRREDDIRYRERDYRREDQPRRW